MFMSTGRTKPHETASEKPEPRRPANRAGSWLAQQGGSGLQFGCGNDFRNPGRQIGRPQSRSKVSRKDTLTPQPVPSNNVPVSAGRGAKTTFTKANLASSPIGDSLDELLLQAQASLANIDRLRRLQESPKPGTGRRSEASAKTADKAVRRRRATVSSFWQPSCNARLWGDGDDSTGKPDACDDTDSESTVSGSDEEPHVTWDFTRSSVHPKTWAGGGKPRAGLNMPSVHAASFDPSFGSAAQHGMPAFDGVFGSAWQQSQRAAAPAPEHKTTAEEHGPEQKHSSRRSSTQRGSSGQRSGPSRTHRGANDQSRQQDHGRQGTRARSARGAEPPPQHRSHEAGFRFGTGSAAPRQGQIAAPPSVVLEGPEREVVDTLATAQAAGTESVKGALKRLLLRWHPDKAPQGDEKEAVAQREEATRVLRFILRERERLGLI